MTRPHISVVVPVYGCEDCLRDLHARLVTSLGTLTDAFEIVLVNDASPQTDWNVIEELAAGDARVRGIDLSRNFGQHHALAAGLHAAAGDWIVVMDCDLQDRPEEIPRLYRAAVDQKKDGAFGRRVTRKDSLVKRTGSKLFYATFGFLVGLDTDGAVGNFSIISRTVVLNLRRFRERTRNYTLNVHWLGFDLTYVDVEHAARHAGQSTYTFGKLVRFAFQSLLFQSTKPLILSIGVGFALAIGSIGYGSLLVVRFFAWNRPPAGWTSVMVSMYFLAGLTFMVLGVIGLYLGSVLEEVKGRPVYVIKRTTDGRDFDPPG